jgi:hypothetical protein
MFTVSEEEITQSNKTPPTSVVKETKQRLSGRAEIECFIVFNVQG